MKHLAGALAIVLLAAIVAIVLLRQLARRLLAGRTRAERCC